MNLELALQSGDIIVYYDWIPYVWSNYQWTPKSGYDQDDLDGMESCCSMIVMIMMLQIPIPI